MVISAAAGGVFKMATARGRPGPRGKGRGIAADAGRQQQRTHKAPQSVEGLAGYLDSLTHGNLGSYGTMFADMVLSYSSNEHRQQEAVELIFDRTTKDREYASLGAKICKLIVESTAEQSQTTEKRTQFRQALLKKFQAEYKARQSTRAQSIEAWLAVFSFLFELFLRVQVQGQPIKVVGGAILSSCTWLLNLDDCDDDETECVCSCLKLVGHLLEQVNADQVKEVIRILRTRAISRKSSSRVRCVALEVLEFRAFGWKDPNKELDSFYCDALPDAIAEDELNSLGQ